MIGDQGYAEHIKRLKNIYHKDGRIKSKAWVGKDYDDVKNMKRANFNARKKGK